MMAKVPSPVMAATPHNAEGITFSGTIPGFGIFGRARFVSGVGGVVMENDMYFVFTLLP
jgi:hypothetical protein